MKLDYKKTVCVGFAFFLICMFWQAYDAIIPMILNNRFGTSQTASGAIMALDNVIALFLLPLLGAISDRSRSRYGKRTPYIFVGTILSAVAFFALAFVDTLQKSKLGGLVNAVSLAYKIEDPDARKAAFEALRPALWEVTKQNPGILILFVGLLLVLLLAMALFRSPAVALMPDVIVKPLRSKANAVINLTGTVGGILVLVLGIVFGTGKGLLDSYVVFFGIVAALMIAALVAFLLTVNEPKLVKEAEEEAARLGIAEEEPVAGAPAAKLEKPQLISLFLILASVALWYMGYNAVTTKYSDYATKVLGCDYNLTLIIAQGAAIVAYIPVGLLSAKLGRRRSILGGVALLGVAFLVCAFLRNGCSSVILNLLFILAGIGWAAINVNSFPMAVELASSGDVGRYTGFYYTAAMAAQIATPVLSGLFMDYVAMEALFPYATVCVAASFVTMFFVKHGDSPETAAPVAEAVETTVE